jgi:hypothetical protein
MSFIDKNFFLFHLSDVILHDSRDLIMIKGIDNDRHPLTKYIKLCLYISEIVGGQKKKI